MSNLLQLPSPAANITDLRFFYDRLEPNIRGLEALGEAHDSYGNLLIPIILERLPSETRRNLARENKSGSWILSDLRQALLREIEIMEAGETHETHNTPFPTAAFHSSARMNRRQQMRYNTSARMTGDLEIMKVSTECVYCEQQHSGECLTVCDIARRLAVIKEETLFSLSKQHASSSRVSFDISL